MSTVLKERVCQIECPECEFEFSVEAPMTGEVLSCPDCQLNLLITGVAAGSVTVELTETDAEDWGE